MNGLWLLTIVLFLLSYVFHPAIVAAILMFAFLKALPAKHVCPKCETSLYLD